MAQQTNLTVTGLPGRTQSFVAKAAAQLFEIIRLRSIVSLTNGLDTPALLIKTLRANTEIETNIKSVL